MEPRLSFFEPDDDGYARLFSALSQSNARSVLIDGPPSTVQSALGKLRQALENTSPIVLVPAADQVSSQLPGVVVAQNVDAADAVLLLDDEATSLSRRLMSYSQMRQGVLWAPAT